MTYDYSRSVAPDSAQIHADVAGSAMTDKTIQGCTWHSDDDSLDIDFSGTLSAGDETILDGIVAAIGDGPGV